MRTICFFSREHFLVDLFVFLSCLDPPAWTQPTFCRSRNQQNHRPHNGKPGSRTTFWLCFLEDLFVCLCVLVFLLCADPCLAGPTIILPKQQSARPRTTNPVCIIVFQDLATILLSLKTGGGDRVDSQLPSLISLFIFV